MTLLPLQLSPIGCRAVLCDFHRENAWSEWIRNVDHGVQNQDVALATLRRIAATDTLQMYEQTLKALHDSKEWIRNPLFQKWFQTTWLQEQKVRKSNDLWTLVSRTCELRTSTVPLYFFKHTRV